LDGIIIRAYSHSDVEELANNASIPVINALTDMYHPCQGIADIFTIKEKKGRIRNIRIGYLGDGNNVCHSLMLGSVMSKANIVIACPHGYEPETEVYEAAKEIAVSDMVSPLLSCKSLELRYNDFPFNLLIATSKETLVLVDGFS
ncbi:unnamed protein product, partial [marine sediment metagenome]